MLEVDDDDDAACTVDDMEVRGKGATRMGLMGGVRGMSPDYGIIRSRLY
jgi:hypothetical protein